MTTSQAHAHPAAWTVLPSDPSINPDRVHHLDCAVSHYGDDRWDLSALGAPVSVRTPRIFWHRFPEQFRASFRRAVWLAINTPTPVVLLEKRGANSVEWASGTSVLKYVHFWVWFANWLQENGIERLCEVTRADLERFARCVQDADFTRSTKAGLLRAVTRLWAYATSLPPADALVMPPWEDEAISDFLPGSARAPENATAIIHPSTMAPLLLWAQRMLELAVDIEAAARRWQSLAEAVPRSHSRESRSAAADLVNGWVNKGISNLPAAINDPRLIDTKYLAAVHGGIHPAQLGVAVRDSGVVFTRNHDTPTPIDSPITAMIDGKPWCDAINKNDLSALRRAVLGAALVMVGYLTGMRPHEVLALRPGCCSRERVSATTIRYTINGRTYKRVRKDGRADPEGAQRSWTTISPVALAVETIERFFPDSTVLFPSGYDDLLPVSTDRAAELIRVLIDTANSICARLSLPKEQWIPVDPAGQVTLTRFRRTLAWHIRRLPHGPVALAIQYGHLSVAQGEGYAGLTAAGFAALLDREEVTALIENIEQARRDLADGAQVSGPAAKRLIELVARGVSFEGTYLRAAEVRRIKVDGRLKFYDNPQSYLACMFDPNKALCGSNRAHGAAREPKLDKCQPNCPNIARTDRHIAGLAIEVSRLHNEADSPLTPTPLALRLRTRADTLGAVIENHHATAIRPTMPSDSSSEATA